VATSRHDQHRLGSVITSMTRKQQHATVNVTSGAPSPT
jgi:hypothetical protein